MISVFGSDIGEEEIAAVSECLRSQWLGFGEEVSRFEKAFMAHLDLPNFAMVDSGSNALFLAIRLLDLPPASEVILPSFTWVSCAQAILLAGHTPVFCDVDLDTMNIRREDVENCLSPRTAAIMVVHYAGLPVELDSILELGFPVIEDAAHAVDARQGRHACGSRGAIGIYSFDAVKNLSAGEGGGITCLRPESLERARRLRYCGIGKSGFESARQSRQNPSRWWEHEMEEAFIKMLPTNIAATIARVQLSRLNALQARRRQIWTSYSQALAEWDEVIRPREAGPEDRHGYFTYCIRSPRRDELARTLLEKGIYTTLRFPPLHRYALYGQSSRQLPNTSRLSCEALSLPLHPRLTDENVESIIGELRKFFQASPSRRR